MSEPVSETTTAQKDDKGKEKSAFYEFVSTIVVAVLIALGFRTVAYEPFNIPSGSMYPTLYIGDYLLVSKFSYGYSQHSLPWSFIPFHGRIFESEVKPGDVAVFKRPYDNSTDFIKRIVGVPGDKIQMIDGVLYINEQPVKREQLEDFDIEAKFVTEDPMMQGKVFHYRRVRETLPNGVSYDTLDCVYFPGTRDCMSSNADNAGPFLVAEGHYFAMGDNRDNSADSRFPAALGVGPLPAENLVGRADIIFFSTCGQYCDAPLWKPWNWFGAMRYSRFFNLIG